MYNYDLIAIFETHLDSSYNENKLRLNGYSFIKQNHPLDIKRGSVGLYFKETLPIKERPDLVPLPECIVCEIKIERKSIFFTVIYRSPSQKQDEFDNFMTDFEIFLSNMSAEKSYAIIISGDLNCRSSQWWENENENEKGKRFEPLVSDLGLHQLIRELTHLMSDHKSCIDLILTDQPNIFIDSGVHPSLHELCHHQIVYGRLSSNCPTLPPPPLLGEFGAMIGLTLMLFAGVLECIVGMSLYN